MNKRGKHCNEKRLYVLRYLLEHPCVDCGEQDPVVLDFDHIDVKEANVSKLINSNHSIERLQAEIVKCVVRCANCHRRKTARDLGSYRLMDVNRLEWIVDSMSTRSERGNVSKLSQAQAEEIRIKWRGGMGYKLLAKEYGVNRTTIRKIVRGESYKKTG